MKLRSQIWVPAVILLISFCFHLSLISKGPVTVDCLNLAIKSQATIATGHLQFLFGSGYPMMVFLGAIFISIGNYLGITDPVMAVNFISVFFSSIAILAFYLLVQKICNNTLTSLIASLILLLNPLFLDVSTYGVNHATTLCFLLLGLLSLLRFKTSGSISGLILSILYFGFMGATRLQDFILTAPAIGFFYFVNLQGSSVSFQKHKLPFFLLFSTAVALVIVSFHLPYFISDHSEYNSQAANFWKIGLSDNYRGFFFNALKISFLYLTNTFSLVGIICFGFGLFNAARSHKGLLIFTVLWGAFPLAFYGNTLTSAPRFFTIILPALIIPMSMVITTMFGHKRLLWRMIAMISFFIIIFGPLLNTHPTFIRRHHYALIPDFYRWVGASTEANAVIISTDDDLFISYYSKRKTLPKPVGYGHLSQSELNEFKSKLDIILKDQQPVYITNLAIALYDRHREFKDLMRQNYRLILIGQRPLELWYLTPFNPQLHLSSLVRIKQKN